jgi:hypothetical protein
MLRARNGEGDAERADALERTAREDAELLGLALSPRREEGSASP